MNNEQERKPEPINSNLKPCAVCGAKITLIVDMTPEGEYDGSVDLIHPDGHPDCWNNNRHLEFRYKKGFRDKAIADITMQWNEHPDFNFFTGGTLSRKWREELKKANSADGYNDADFNKELDRAKSDPAIEARIGEKGRERLRKVVFILDHYDHAREKHPYFCDKLVNYFCATEDVVRERTRAVLEQTQSVIDKAMRSGELTWRLLLIHEADEVEDAIVNGNTDAAINECYDAIAVLLRVVDVLEGRQTLGEPEEKEGVK